MERLYFKQLLSGRDFAKSDALAHQMVNFCYLIGDRETGETAIIDPAYGAQDLLEILAADGMHLTAMLATHYHPDHVGSSAFLGHRVEGVKELLELGVQAKVHCQQQEAAGLAKVTEIGAADIVEHSSGDVIQVGAIPIQMLHTPGHTPGSQCFMVNGCLVSGDTLFIDGCGRTDLPGGSPEQMYDSMQLLASLPGETTLFPGHQYSPEPSLALSELLQRNYVFRFKTKEQWAIFNE